VPSGDQAARLKLLRSLPHGHVAAALGLLRKVGLDHVLSPGGRRPAREVALCIAMMVARLIDPASKLATARLLDGATATCSLGAVLGLGAVDEQALYDALDWLTGQQERIEKAVPDRAGILQERLGRVSSSKRTGVSWKRLRYSAGEISSRSQ
jgi:hypothetical protein